VKLSHRVFLSFFPFSEAIDEGPKLIFTQNTSKDAVPRKDVPFGGFENKNNNT